MANEAAAPWPEVDQTPDTEIELCVWPIIQDVNAEHSIICGCIVCEMDRGR